MLGRFGSCADEVIALMEADRGLAQPIDGADDFMRAEAVHAVSHAERKSQEQPDDHAVAALLGASEIVPVLPVRPPPDGRPAAEPVR
jgi:hypothetical protein